MPSFRFLIGAAFLMSVVAPATGHAKAKATLRDRFDQIIATFMGDPAAEVDIDMKHVLDRWRGMGPKPLETVSIDEARKQPTPIEAAGAIAKKEGKDIAPYTLDVKQIAIPTLAGLSQAQVYTPTHTTGHPLPVVVFFHGGGFVTDNAPGTDASARAISGTGGYIVVAPSYRLAPEAKFPAAVEDCAAVYKWVTEHATEIGGDPDKIALAGEGAGGLLAADTVIAARDGKWAKPSALVLITPSAGINLKTNSWLEDSAARPWNKEAVLWALKLYLVKDIDKFDPRVDVVGAANVEHFPPTTIVTAEVDPLRSDGERLGGKLKLATVPVSMRDYSGVTHDFFGMGQVVDKAAAAQQYVAEQLQRAFAPPTGQSVALQDLGVSPYPEAPNPAVAPPSGTGVPTK